MTRPTLAAAALLCAFLSFPVHADSLQDVQTLIRQGQHAQALDKADQFLASKPRDAQMRFLKGVALSELNRPAEAIGVFQKLTEDYPELPEPYNNLAVLYAQQRQYEKARNALEMAIRTHPSYATAHENLGDVYARLASQAYDKALQIDSSNVGAQNKLSLIRDLITLSGRPVKPVARGAAPAPVVVAQAAARPVAAPVAKPQASVKPQPAPAA
ncbi:MAG: tetratricopeptide repeat protein, partial [Zoogloea sp.]|nr:tetratricopeptide repeat protein [Zoogloea sp.]